MSDNELIELQLKYKQSIQQLSDYKSKYEKLKDNVDKLVRQSGYRSIFIELFPTTYGEMRALVNTQGTREEVKIAPGIEYKDLEIGKEVLVTHIDQKTKCISEVRGYTYTLGRLGKVNRVIGDNAVIDEPGAAVELLLTISTNIKDLKSGDIVRYEPQTRVAFEKVEDENASSYTVDSTQLQPFTFDDIGGLKEEKRLIKERIVYPLIHKDKFEKYGINPPKGFLLYGPPGNGKSIMACAIFNELAKMYGQSGDDISENFFVINSAEVLSKWVGNSEKAVRDIFEKARGASEKSGVPAVIFWDEIESIMRARSESASYQASATLVPTLLTELSGIKKSGEILFIAASNRPDLIDSALMRAGRLGDLKIEIKRVNEQGAEEILNNNLKDKPIADGYEMADVVSEALNAVYNSPKIGAIAFQNGDVSDLYYKDIVNGAMLVRAINEASLNACVDEIDGNPSGISPQDVVQIITHDLDNTLSLIRPHNIIDFVDIPPHLMGVGAQIVTQL